MMKISTKSRGCRLQERSQCPRIGVSMQASISISISTKKGTKMKTAKDTKTRCQSLSLPLKFRVSLCRPPPILVTLPRRLHLLRLEDRLPGIIQYRLLACRESRGAPLHRDHLVHFPRYRPQEV